MQWWGDCRCARGERRRGARGAGGVGELTIRGTAPAAGRSRPSARPRTAIRVAIVCDEFTYNSFAPEFELVPLTPEDWRQELADILPDLFLCESAWAGPDSVARPWRGPGLRQCELFPRENRGELFGILEYCRAAGIPTVFWNKEDPSHYEDRRHDFVRTAPAFRPHLHDRRRVRRALQQATTATRACTCCRSPRSRGTSTP